MINQEFLIHIGYHKTGSTFLQKNVFPTAGLRQLMLPMDYIARQQDYEPQQLMQLLNKQYGVQSWNGKQVVISQESLVGHKDGDPIWDRFAVAQNLHSTFPNAKILIVLRNQFDYIMSLYTFKVYVKGIERRSLSTYLRQNRCLAPGLYGALQYDQLIAKYQQLFGKEKVLVLLYEQLAENAPDFVHSITEFMRYEPVLNYESNKVNVANKNFYIILFSRLLNYPFSLTMELLTQTGILTSEQPNPSRLQKMYRLMRKNAVNPMLNKLFATNTRKVDFPAHWKEHFQPIFAQSNQRVAELINLDLTRYGYPL